MNAQVAHARAEIRPALRTGYKFRRRVENEDDTDADAKQEKPEARIFRQKRHSHDAMMRRSFGLRKSNRRASLTIKERLEIAVSARGVQAASLLISAALPRCAIRLVPDLRNAVGKLPTAAGRQPALRREETPPVWTPLLHGCF